MLGPKKHLQLATEALEVASVHFMDAVRAGEIFTYAAGYLDKFDLLKRATVNLRKQLEMNGKQGAFEFVFEGPPELQSVLPLYGGRNGNKSRGPEKTLRAGDEVLLAGIGSHHR